MKRLFIVGAPRSGTTLLQSLVATHPRLISFPETDFVRYADSLRYRYFLWGGSGVLGASWASYNLEGFFAFCQQKYGRVPLIPRTFSSKKVKMAFWKYLDEIASENDSLGWIEKTPTHLRSIDSISQSVQEVQFLHVVRSGFETIVSMFLVATEYATHWGKEYQSVESCCDIWLQDTLRTFCYSRNPRHKVIDYSDLVADPNRVRADIFCWMGMSTQEPLLDRSSVAGDLVLPREIWKSEVVLPIKSRSQSRSAGLTSDQRNQINSFLKWSRERLSAQANQEPLLGRLLSPMTERMQRSPSSVAGI
ncbi:MAG: sulfotransferase [Bdellovibrionales bacterium]|nr:sulfotransferase [Bdellovibrionales bacterium]